MLILYMNAAFNIKCTLEIEKDGQTYLTLKRVALLKTIKNKGSINAAAKELKMSYQQAWFFIQEMNEHSPLPLVIRKRGGANGGGAELTGHGEKTIKEFEKLLFAYSQFEDDTQEALDFCFF